MNYEYTTGHAALSSEVTADDAYTRRIMPHFGGPYTPGNDPAGEKYLDFLIYRRRATGNLDAVAYLLGVDIIYQVDKANDD